MMAVVSGGVGFIGSHLTKHLAEMGHKVTVVDRRAPRERVDGVAYEVEDLANPYYAYADNRPDILYHLAASPWSMVRGDAGWFASSGEAFRNNVVGMYNALREIQPRRVVFSSTANVYGEGRKLGEDSPIAVSSGYGWSKWLGEEMLRKSGIPYTIYRFGTVVGSRGRTFPNRLVWCAVHDEPVEVFCNGEAWRDLVDVRDIVSALTLDAPQDTFNVSLGEEVCGRALAELVAEEAGTRGFKLRWSLTDFVAPGYVRESTLDNTKLRARGWAPRIDVYRMVEGLFDHYEHEQATEPPRWDKI